MKSLLYKDYLTLRTYMLLFLASVLLFLLIGFIKINTLLLAATFFVLIIPFQLVSVEEKNNSHIYVNSLPVNRNTVVQAKYLFTLMAGVFLIGSAKMVHVFFAFPPGNGFWDVLVVLVAVSGFMAVFYPLYIGWAPSLSKSVSLSFSSSSLI